MAASTKTTPAGKHCPGKHCPGCGRKLGPGRPWCAVCQTRMPRDVIRAVVDADARLATAIRKGVGWLGQHPSASQKDLDILLLVMQGQQSKQIGETLRISEHTVKDHLRRMSQRWGCRGRAQLVATAIRLGYITLRKGDGSATA